MCGERKRERVMTQPHSRVQLPIARYGRLDFLRIDQVSQECIRPFTEDYQLDKEWLV